MNAPAVTKSDQDQSAKLSDLNKKIMEIKKKIQLSEGQRKALFEVCEGERKSNADSILKLKKEISQLVVVLHESSHPSAKYLLGDKRLEEIIGPLDNKSTSQVQNLLDLQIIDKSKQLNLLRYRIKQRKKYLAELGSEYQTMLSKKEKKELTKKVDKPMKKASSDLQNNIHAVEVQVREANHIRHRYMDIRKSLKDDSDKFESNIAKLEEELEVQNSDVNKLKKIMDEATRMRAMARGNLLHEEKTAMSAAHKREKEALEGKRLVNERKQELERLERRLFQGGKAPVRSEPDGAEEGAQADDEKPETPPHPFELLTNDFEVLKQATGGTSTEEVLERFKSQKDTLDRLTFLRTTSELEKKQLEQKLDDLKTQLDRYKYAEVKDAERKTAEMERLQKGIDDQHEKCCAYKARKIHTEEALKSITTGLQGLYLCIKPLGVPNKGPLELLKCIEDDLKEILRRQAGFKDKIDKVIRIDVHDDKWLPAPYSGLVRRTPLPQPGASPAPPPAPGSDDEEEVPSRGYLKRQAQLVIDAKSRRKNVRIQIPKRN